LAYQGDSRSEPDADLTIGADKGAFGGNAPDNIFGGQERPPGWFADASARRGCHWR